MSDAARSSPLDLDASDRRFRSALMAFFTRRVGDRAEAEDLTQEVFVRLARAGPQHLRSADAYIFHIAANLIRDRGRSLAFRSGQIDALTASEERRVEPVDAERILIGKDDLEAVVSVLNELSQRTRDIFLLNRLEGLSHRALAQAFSMSTSGVEKHIYKATAYLAHRFEKNNERGES